MKKMKFITCALLALSLLKMSAFADTKISISGNDVVLSVDGNANTWGTLIVVKAGDSLDNDNIVTMKQAFSDYEGRYEFGFAMSDALGAETVNAKYDLYIKDGSDDVKKAEMFYATIDDRDSIANDLLKADSTSQFAEIIEKAENEIILRAMGFDFEKYDAIKTDSEAKSAFAEIFIESADDVSGSNETSDVLNKALLVEYINIDSHKNAEYIKELNLSFESVKFGDVKDEKLKSFVTDYMYSDRKYKSIKEVANAYECANILYILNNTRFSVIEKNLEKYSEKLGISFESEYKKYTESKNKSSVNEDIVALLKTSPAESVESLLSVIKKAVDKNSDKTGGSGGGGGGGSSGGSGGSGGGGSSSVSGGEVIFPAVEVPFVAEIKPVFGDIKDVVWAEEAINALSAKGIINGDENGNFNPHNKVKREEFVKMLVVAANMHDEKASCNFADISSGAWYYSYVASAYNQGLVNGVSEYEFGLSKNITRQDLAVMCYRAAKNVREIEFVRDNIVFADKSYISDYASEAVEALYRAAVINGVGDNEFAPLTSATRAEAAVIIYNLFVK